MIQKEEPGIGEWMADKFEAAANVVEDASAVRVDVGGIIMWSGAAVATGALGMAARELVRGFDMSDAMMVLLENWTPDSYDAFNALSQLQEKAEVAKHTHLTGVVACVGAAVGGILLHLRNIKPVVSDDFGPNLISPALRGMAGRVRSISKGN